MKKYFLPLLLAPSCFAMMSNNVEEQILQDEVQRQVARISLSQGTAESIEYIEHSNISSASIITLPLEEQLQFHQSKIANIFTLQEEKIVQLEARIATLQTELEEKNAMIAEQRKNIEHLNNELCNMREEQGRLNARLSAKEISLEEALLANQALEQRLSQQDAQINVILNAASELNRLRV